MDSGDKQCTASSKAPKPEHIKPPHQTQDSGEDADDEAEPLLNALRRAAVYIRLPKRKESSHAMISGTRSEMTAIPFSKAAAHFCGGNSAVTEMAEATQTAGRMSNGRPAAARMPATVAE
jgi:hypothetical protein